MQLECPLCRRRISVAPPESPAGDRHMMCPHCRAPLVLDQYAGRLAAFKAAIALNPRYSHAYDNLGWIYLRRNDHETSLAYLNQSPALRPENGWAYYNRGRIHFQMGQTEKAFQDAEDACRLGFEKACALLKRSDRKTGS